MAHPLLRPRALLGHALVLSVAVTCVLLGQWQLDRLDEVRTRNERVAERLTQPPVDLAALADPGAGAATDPAARAELAYRRVTATGTFVPGEEVLQRNQSYQGQTGFHVLTPLELDGGGVVLVRRGWVPAEHDDPPVDAAAPPPGVVTVSGVLEPPVSQPGFGATDPAEGVLERVFHPDTARLDAQVTGALFPMVLRDDSDPEPVVARGALPVPVGPPTLDEANHLSYAVQWHVFALLAVVTYGAWLATRGRTGRSPATVAEQGGGAGGIDRRRESMQGVDVGGGPQR